MKLFMEYPKQMTKKGDKIGVHEFAGVYLDAYYETFTKANIASGFANAGVVNKKDLQLPR